MHFGKILGSFSWFFQEWWSVEACNFCVAFSVIRHLTRPRQSLPNSDRPDKVLGKSEFFLVTFYFCWHFSFSEIWWHFYCLLSTVYGVLLGHFIAILSHFQPFSAMFSHFQPFAFICSHLYPATAMSSCFMGNYEGCRFWIARSFQENMSLSKEYWEDRISRNNISSCLSVCWLGSSHSLLYQVPITSFYLGVVGMHCEVDDKLNCW